MIRDPEITIDLDSDSDARITEQRNIIHIFYAQERIIHLITGLEIGGTEMMLLKTLPGLQGDFDNRVCCIRGHGSIGKRLENAGVPVVYLELKIFLILVQLSVSVALSKNFNQISLSPILSMPIFLVAFSVGFSESKNHLQSTRKTSPMGVSSFH